MKTLRERLIDALETHSVTWPPACPPLEPARYCGLGQAGCGVVQGHRPGGERVVAQERGPRLVLPVALGQTSLRGPEGSLVLEFQPRSRLPGADWQVRGPIPPHGKEKGRGLSGPDLLLPLTPVPRNVWGYSRNSGDLTQRVMGQWAWVVGRGSKTI